MRRDIARIKTIQKELAAKGADGDESKQEESKA
jgi:hypothetical protein